MQITIGDYFRPTAMTGVLVKKCCNARLKKYTTNKGHPVFKFRGATRFFGGRRGVTKSV